VWKSIVDGIVKALQAAGAFLAGLLVRDNLELREKVKEAERRHDQDQEFHRDAADPAVRGRVSDALERLARDKDGDQGGGSVP
jgi:hypothetical protein